MLVELNPSQIVCGAPNVAAETKSGGSVAGNTVHPTNGDPFTINCRQKFVASKAEGMIMFWGRNGFGEQPCGNYGVEHNCKDGTLAPDYF